MNNIGKQIQALRKRTKLTQEEFSKRVGVGLRFIRDLEQGKPSVRLDKVNQVLDFLGHHLEVTSNHKVSHVPDSKS
jgi:y4mF family transcriptional regulator